MSSSLRAIILHLVQSQLWVDPVDLTAAYSSLWEIDCCLSMLLPFIMSLADDKVIEEGAHR